MPFEEFAAYDLETTNNNNKVSAFLLSSDGRYIWSDGPFKFEYLKEGKIRIVSKYEKVKAVCAGKTLRDAYSAASGNYFASSGTIPPEEFFLAPQYNTWIELMYDQNQEDVLRYAHDIIDNGFAPGVLMIDDNWQNHYGNHDFRTEQFPDPKAMTDELHALGFKVMVWVCPFVDFDTPEYELAAANGWLIRKKGTQEPCAIKWWNGESACYDLTNPEAFAHLAAELKSVQERYGVDGFKFDAGDVTFYDMGVMEGADPEAMSVTHTLAWERLGLEFPYNEYRAGWQMQLQPLVMRLGDKDYSWEAVKSLIPEMMVASLEGYPYGCPDMIGGGQYKTFLNLDSDDFDGELIVRSAQIHALMPMMQFSVAPWRVLDAEHLDAVKKAAALHVAFGDRILDLARKASRTGEPIVRNLEYDFPHEGLARCNDQFMLGDRYMVAPMVESGTQRNVVLPSGMWRDDRDEVFEGGQTIMTDVPLDRLPYYEKIN